MSAAARRELEPVAIGDAADERYADWPCRTISIDDLDDELAQSEYFACALVVRGVDVQLAAGDFGFPWFRAIAVAAEEVRAAGVRISAAAIVGELRQARELDRLRFAGGLDLIVALVEHRPIEACTRMHVARIRAAARRRRIASRALELHLAARDGDDAGVARALAALEAVR